MKYALDIFNNTSSSNPFREFDRLFENYFNAPTLSSRASNLKPATDVVETDSHYLLSVDLPGVSKENISIQAENGVLSLTGERKYENSSSEETTHWSEKFYGSFSRKFELPDGVEAEKVEAEFKDGVLHLAVPKAEAKKARVIPILDQQKESLLSRLTRKKEN